MGNGKSLRKVQQREVPLRCGAVSAVTVEAAGRRFNAGTEANLEALCTICPSHLVSSFEKQDADVVKGPDASGGA